MVGNNGCSILSIKQHRTMVPRGALRWLQFIAWCTAREGLHKARWSWESWEVNVTSVHRTEERRHLLREKERKLGRPAESLWQNTDWCMHVRKLPEPVERTTQKERGKHSPKCHRAGTRLCSHQPDRKPSWFNSHWEEESDGYWLSNREKNIKPNLSKRFKEHLGKMNCLQVI